MLVLLLAPAAVFGQLVPAQLDAIANARCMTGSARLTTDDAQRIVLTSGAMKWVSDQLQTRGVPHCAEFGSGPVLYLSVTGLAINGGATLVLSSRWGLAMDTELGPIDTTIMGSEQIVSRGGRNHQAEVWRQTQLGAADVLDLVASIWRRYH